MVMVIIIIKIITILMIMTIMVNSKIIGRVELW